MRWFIFCVIPFFCFASQESLKNVIRQIVELENTNRIVLYNYENQSFNELDMYSYLIGKAHAYSDCRYIIRHELLIMEKLL